jgi:hypothetical protein
MDSCKFIFKTFLSLKRNGTMKTKSFWFQHVDENIVSQFFKQLPNKCSPGSGILPMKILKASFEVLAPQIVHIFNACIDSCTFPDNWKIALVTPLFKNKAFYKAEKILIYFFFFFIFIFLKLNCKIV